MYYRYLIEKDNNKSGLFHPLPEWGVPKEGGLYDIVPKYFESLPYRKTFEEGSISWFTEYGNDLYLIGIKALTSFYEKFGVRVICIKKEKLDDIADRDEYQVWCYS